MVTTAVIFQHYDFTFLPNLIVCLTMSQKLHTKVGRFGFSQNLFEMRLAKNRIN